VTNGTGARPVVAAFDFGAHAKYVTACASGAAVATAAAMTR